MSSVTFQVAGRPQQKGSKRAFANKNGGRPIIVDMNKKAGPWMAAVAEKAAEAMNGRTLLDGPVRLYARFRFKRPMSHYLKRKGGIILRLDAPDFHCSQPDVDKLVRSLGDAMNGVVFRDDAQIAEIDAAKFYTAGSEGVEIEVVELPAEPVNHEP